MNGKPKTMCASAAASFEQESSAAKGEIADGESKLLRLAELAVEFGAAQIAAAASADAERVSEGRFYVACVGQFKRGKSTLLNALLGQAVLPAGIVPITTVPTIVRYGDPASARVRLGMNTWREIPFDAIEEYVSEEKNSGNAKGVSGIEIFVPGAILSRGMCLVDTPGLGSVFAANTEATHSFVPHIDAAIVVVGADPPLSGEELRLLEAVGEEVHDLLLVLNKADRVGEAEHRTAAEFTRRMWEQRLKRPAPEVYVVSALEQLERRGPARDWPKLAEALERLVEHSSRSLIQSATVRALRRTCSQLLQIVREECGALQHPVEESERRIAEMRKMLEQVDRAFWDLGHLLGAEQQRLSQTLAERQKAFLKPAQKRVREKIIECAPGVSGQRNGPALRRSLMHLAQDLVRAELLPWLEEEEKFAEAAFCSTVQRFVELGNDFLRRVDREELAGPGELPAELSSKQSLRGKSQFSFHDIERVAAPASPLLFLSDLLLGALGWRKKIVNDAMEFASQLLEVNSARVQNDVDERVRMSRAQLEREIKEALREAMSIAERALDHARSIQAAGAPAVEAALGRLADKEANIHSLWPST